MASLGVATLESEFDSSGLQAGLNKAQQITNGFLSGWSRAFQVAAGFIIRDAILAIGRAVVGLGKQAMDATAEWERMGLSMQALVARELRQIDVTLTMADALEKAKGRTAELLSWVQKLAIQSPFDVKSVQNAFQTALAYGFTTKMAQKLTGTLIDFAAATGKDADVMDRAALALGQIQAKGKLAGQEILQLVNAGVPVNDILKSMGKNLNDVSAGTVKADEFIQAFVDTLDHDFGGSAARQTETWTGLINSFDDIKKIGLRTLFKGIFDQIQPLAAKFSTWLQGPGMKKLEDLGGFLGTAAKNGLELLGVIDRMQFFFGNLEKGMTLKGALHRLFPDLNLDGAVSEKFIGFLEDALDLSKKIGGKVLDIKDFFDKTSERAKFFFENLQKGMTPAGALSRLFPELNLRPILAEVQKSIDFFAPLGQKIWGSFKENSEKLLGQVIPWAIEQWQKLVDWFEKNRPLIEGAITLWVDLITKVFIPAIFGMWQFIGPILTGVLDFILGTITFWLQVLAGDWQGAWGTLVLLVQNAAGSIALAVVGFLNWIANVMGTSLAEIGATWGANWNMFVQIINTAWSMIVIAITTWVNSAFAFIVFTFTTWLIYFTNIWMNITAVTTLAWINIQMVITNALIMLSLIIIGFAKPIIESFQTMFNKAIDMASVMANQFGSVGLAIMNGIAAGIAAGADAVIDAISDVIEAAIAAAMGALDAHSPSVVFTKIGKFVPAGLSAGVLDGVDKAVKAVEGASLEIGMAMTPMTYETAYQAGSYAAQPMETTETNRKQIGPFYAPVTVGKLEDLEKPDPLRDEKVQ